MAIIVCPECKREISDKATSCPGCGYPLQQTTENPATISPQMAGVADEPSPPSSKPKRKFILVAIALLLVAVSASICLIISRSQHESQMRAEYAENVHAIRIIMLQGAADAEGVCNLVRAVWHDTIFEELNENTYKYTISADYYKADKSYAYYVGYSMANNEIFNDDFNVSIGRVYADEEIMTAIANIEANREDVVQLYSTLSNPPVGFEACYDTLSAMYDVYFSLTGLALSPSGNYNTYSANLGSYDSDFMKYFEKLELEIPNT